jgi:hypothetical protein
MGSPQPLEGAPLADCHGSDGEVEAETGVEGMTAIASASIQLS